MSSAALPPPVKVTSVIKVSRWSLLVLGIFWGVSRNQILGAREAAIREKEEAERPAKEAAMKAEKERKYREEMEYLGRETGVISGGGGGSSAKAGGAPGSGGGGGAGTADCGCRY